MDGVIAREADLAVPAVAADEHGRVDDPASRNPFGEADGIAARASSPGTRRQYAAIYRTFADWLRGELDHPPVVADLDADVVAAYIRLLQTSGGHSGGAQHKAYLQGRCTPRSIPGRSDDVGLSDDGNAYETIDVADQGF